MADRLVEGCVDCRRPPPPTNTNYTLISSQYGWRLIRRRTEEWDVRAEWRCPPCWKVYREKQRAALALEHRVTPAGGSRGRG